MRRISSCHAGAGRHPTPNQAAYIQASVPFRVFAGMTLLVMAWASLAALAISALVTPAHADAAFDAAFSPAPARQHELVRLVRQECGFCHGLHLTGGLGSPLTAEAIRERPAEAMTATILQGRQGTAMPGWAPFLSEAEADWIVRKLQEGFPQ